MKLYSLIAIILFSLGIIGAVASLTLLPFNGGGLGGSSISIASTFGPAFAFVFKRKFSKREIKFKRVNKNDIT